MLQCDVDNISKKKVKRTLRVRISNTCTSQPWQVDLEREAKRRELLETGEGKDSDNADGNASAVAALEASLWNEGGGSSEPVDFETGSGIPSWTLKIEGELLPVR
jgi:SWI/SNF-related matrix-associated actin-dependent regulator of chromatin subfamily D